MKMPDRPETWAAALAWLQTVAPSLYAFGLSVTIAVLRVVYGGGSKRQMILEGLLCGLITLALVPLVEYFGLPQSMATFIGGACGFIGTEKLRDLAVRWGEKKASA
jgi:lambda family phage holin